MNIIICGAGRVGFTIAKLLSEQGHSITVIDQSSDDIQKINAHGGSLRCYIKNSKNFKKTIRCNKILKDDTRLASIQLFIFWSNKLQ